MIFLWIIVAIIVFSVVILVHEWGHFSAARRFWVKVEEFGLWIPPRAKKLFTDKKWTLFSLNWLPLWGFVKLYGENPELLKNKDDKEALFNKAAWQQSIIILAWVFMNFVLAIFIFSLLFFIWVKPIWVNTKIPTDLEIKLIPTYKQAIESWLLIKNPWVILTPIENSVAEKSNLKSWDILYSIYTCESKMLNHVICEWWEKEISHTINSPEDMIKIIEENAWKDVAFYINLRLLSQEEKLELNSDSDYIWWAFVKVSIPEEWKIWAYVWDNISINQNFEYKYSIIDSIKYWSLETYSHVILTFKWLWILIKKIFAPITPIEREEALQQMSWPIWIVDFISNSVSSWVIFILIITAIISINLWVFNLLPIPALDGWRFVFITLNWLIHKAIWKKIISEQSEAIIHFLFFIILIALSLLIWYNDIIKIIER